MKRREDKKLQAKPVFEQLEQRLLLSGTGTAIEMFNISPALFVENQGQWADSSLRYVHNGNNANVGMTDTGALFQVFRSEASDEDSPLSSPDDHLLPDDIDMHMLQFSASFVDANSVVPIGLDPSAAKFNYFIGDQANWQSDVPSYEMVGYEQLYDGIDLYTWGQRDSLKYEFHVAPGANYQQIAISYEGIEGLSVDQDGSLLVSLGGDWGQLTDDAPYIYQEIDGERVEVSGAFELLDANTYVFHITGDYDSTEKLIIDPDLAWATYLGESNTESSTGIAVDSAGRAYVTGVTYSSGWASPGAYDESHNGYSDVFVAKLSADGSDLLYATYLGGSDYDDGYGIAVDSAGSAYVTGWTDSSGWATPGAYDESHNGYSDVFVARLSADGSDLLYATYLGGSDYEYGLGIAVDSAGRAYVTGVTYSSGWASPGAYDESYNGNTDVFVAKIYDGFPITGRVLYKDQAGSFQDAAYLWVEVWERDAVPLLTDYKIAEGYTGADGRFAFSHDIYGNPIVNEDLGALQSGTRDIYFKIRAQNEAAQVSANWVAGSLGAPYWFDTDVEYDISGPVYWRDLYFSATDYTPSHAACWGLPGEVKSHRDWLMSITDPYYARDSLDVLFPDSNWPSYGWTFTWWPLYEAMRIPETWTANNQTITWQDSPDTVAHEYGHAVHWDVRGGGWPTWAVPIGEEDPGNGTPDAGRGGHWVYSESSEGFALVEGWAEFFQCARYDNESLSWLLLEENHHWMGTDTHGNPWTGENDDGNLGNVVEGAVASILWDLWDGGPGDDWPAQSACRSACRPACRNRFLQSCYYCRRLALVECLCLPVWRSLAHYVCRVIPGT